MASPLCRTGFGLIAAAAVVVAGASADPQEPASDAPLDAQVLRYEMPLLDGTMQDLADYKGKVVLIVNTASKCGLTPQYEDLQALYETHEGDGLVVLGFPANNFRNQEPGSDKQIAEFCAQNYGVTFPMFSKISVKGDDIAPLYEQLVAQPAPVGGEIQWNFDKFLVDRTGAVVARFPPRTRTTDEAFKKKLAELLDTDG